MPCYLSCEFHKCVKDWQLIRETDSNNYYNCWAFLSEMSAYQKDQTWAIHGKEFSCGFSWNKLGCSFPLSLVLSIALSSSQGNRLVKIVSPSVVGIIPRTNKFIILQWLGGIEVIELALPDIKRITKMFLKKCGLKLGSVLR